MKSKNIFDEGDESKEQTGNFPASTFVKGNLTIIKGLPSIMGCIVIYKGFPYGALQVSVTRGNILNSEETFREGPRISLKHP